MHMISWAYFCNVINLSNNSVPPWHYVCPIANTIFSVLAMCNPACGCSSETLLHATHSSSGKQLSSCHRWVMEWLKPTQKGSSAFLMEQHYKGGHSSQLQQQQMIYWVSPTPRGPAISHLFLPILPLPHLHPPALPRNLPLFMVIAPLQLTAHTPHPVYCTSSSSRFPLPQCSVPASHNGPPLTASQTIPMWIP